MSLETSIETHRLELQTPFTIARGTREHIENTVVKIQDTHGNVGIGGAAPSPHYGETPATVNAVLPELLQRVERIGDPQRLAYIERELASTVAENPAAKSAVSIALHDLVAKRADLPLFRYWGLDPTKGLETSYTIGINAPNEMAEMAETASQRGFSTLKVKLGTDRDRARLEAVRAAAPDATIRVDANEAWSPTEAVQKIEEFASFDLEFVEQPVPAELPGGMEYVRARSPVPIAADESCVTRADIPRVVDSADIVTIKLMKCGGLRAAKEMMVTARTLGLEVMLGCMVETNASIAAAAQLAPLLDYADLDGSLLLADDPYDGIPMPKGNISLADCSRPGTGAVRKEPSD